MRSTEPSPTLTTSAAGAARALGLGKAKTLALIHDGRLPAKQLDGRIRVRLVDLDAFLASLPTAAVTPWAPIARRLDAKHGDSKEERKSALKEKREYLLELSPDSVELDAIEPGQLRSLVRDAIMKHTTKKRIKATETEEELIKDRLSVIADEVEGESWRRGRAARRCSDETRSRQARTVRSAAATGKIISRADAWARDIGISSVGLWKRIKAWEAAVLPLNYAR